MKPLIPHRAELNTGDNVNGKYSVVKTLGEGAFGHVYKVKALNGTEYAMKLLRLWEVPSDIRQPLMDRFDMEFKTGRIDSRYLVQSFDYGYCSDNPYIIMEYCPGGDLSSLKKKDSNVIARAASDVLHGLNDLHVNGKVHRDLKPENVLFKSNGVAALTDFGICGDRNRRMTERSLFGKPYQIFGTYAYMPPEQVNRARGMATVLPTTDLFSFGVMIYQLLTGELPFGKLEDQNDLVLYQKRGKNGDWNRNALLQRYDGRMWSGLLEKCLNPDFKQRIQSAVDALSLLPKFQVGNNNSSLIADFEKKAVTERKSSVLRVMHGENYGNCYDMNEILGRTGRMMLTVGRSASSDIRVNNPYASRLHCTIEKSGADWLIRDGQWNASEQRWVGSSNGTYVNSRQVCSKGYWMQQGDIITIGENTFKFE